MANMMQMMAKAQQFKTKMQAMQENVQRMDVPGESGGGLVKCIVTGKVELKSIKIDPSLVRADDIEMLEDLIVAAINDARGKAEKLMAEETQKLMDDMGLPRGSLPF